PGSAGARALAPGQYACHFVVQRAEPRSCSARKLRRRCFNSGGIGAWPTWPTSWRDLRNVLRYATQGGQSRTCCSRLAAAVASSVSSRYSLRISIRSLQVIPPSPVALLTRPPSLEIRAGPSRDHRSRQHLAKRHARAVE